MSSNHRTRPSLSGFTTAFIFLLLAGVTLSAQIPRSLSYQGILVDNAGMAMPNGSYTLAMRMYDAANDGTLLHEQSAIVEVVDGLFATTIGPFDVEMAFDRPYWLAIALSGGSEMSPRTPLQASPYALSAASATSIAPEATGLLRSLNGLDGTVNIRGANGTTVRVDEGEIIIGAVGGEGSPDAWLVGGNSGIDPQNDRFGTTDGAPVLMMTGGRTTLGLYPAVDAARSEPNVIIGTGHTVAPGVYASTIASGFVDTLRSHFSFIAGSRNTIEPGSEHSTIGGGMGHRVGENSARATIGGGLSNTIGNESLSATIGGGYLNNTGEASGAAVVAGGFDNDIDSGSRYAAILGGLNNKIGKRSNSSSIGGGVGNEIGPDVVMTTIGGGSNNMAMSDVEGSVIAGGIRNELIGPEVYGAAILGGSGNLVRASYSSIAGGQANDIDSASLSDFIGSGNSNVITGRSSYSAILIGRDNTIGSLSRYSTILGGEANYVEAGISSTILSGDNNEVIGSRNVVLGGRGLILEGNESFGFLAGNSGGNAPGNHSMTIGASKVAVLGNTDLWLANNTGETSRIVFFTPENFAGIYPSDADDVQSLSLEAPDELLDSKGIVTDIEYILPASIPIAAGDNPNEIYLAIASVRRPFSGKLIIELEWTEASNMTDREDSDAATEIHTLLDELRATNRQLQERITRLESTAATRASE